MVQWQQPDDGRCYGTEERAVEPAIECVANALGDTPELIEGYLVVAARIDKTLTIAHNACCLPHWIAILLTEIERHPELAEPHGEHKKTHER